MTATPQSLDGGWRSAWLGSSHNPWLFATGVLGYLPAGAPNPGKLRQLEDWQDRFLRDFYVGADGKPTDEPRHSVRSGHGVGKSPQPKALMIETPAGLRRFGEVAVGDKVFGRDGQPTTVLRVVDKGVLPVFRLTFTDGSSTLSSGDHLWTVRGRQQRRGGDDGWVTITTQEIIDKGVRRPNGGGYTSAQWEIPIAGPAQFPFQWVPVDPYTLGAWIGDGTRLTPCITSKDAEMMQRIRAAGYEVTQRRKGSLTDDLAPCWTVHGLSDGLRRAGLHECGSPDRFVPEGYKRNIPEIRAEMLRGLMDSDGWVSEWGAAQFASSSLRLAQDVAWLVRSLGGMARLKGGKETFRTTEDGARISGRPSYIVTITMPDGFRLFHLSRKSERSRTETQKRYLSRFIESIELEGEADCMCIQVDAPDSLYLTNDFIVTHNTVIAILALWFLTTHYDAKCVVTANTETQLKTNNWPEIKKQATYLPDELRSEIDAQEERISLKGAPEMAFIVRRTAAKSNPEALAGIHAEHVLYLVDEASGILDIIFETAQGSLSTRGAMAALFSNPTRSSGFFFDTHHKLRNRWRCTHVSSEDVPRATGHITDIIAAYGKGSNKYRVRVLGDFPTQDDETVIPLEWVLSAQSRDVAARMVKPVWGVDVARFGDDRCALAKRRGNKLTERIKWWQHCELTVTAGRIKSEYDSTSLDEQPYAICVDVIGMGAGVVDILKEQRLPVIGINVAEGPSASEEYHRLRDELWWLGREWFRARDCSIPQDEELVADLIGPTYDFNTSGAKVIESKKEMKKRGVRSPDLADAFLLTFAASDRRVDSVRRRRDSVERPAGV